MTDKIMYTSNVSNRSDAQVTHVARWRTYFRTGRLFTEQRTGREVGNIQGPTLFVIRF
jgi:hypothetical protein